MIPDEFVDPRVTERPVWSAFYLCFVPFAVVIDQKRYVLGPIAKRFHMNRHRADAMAQILCESTCFNIGLEVVIGGGDHPGIRFDGLLRTQSMKSAVLQAIQEFRLQRQGHIADFIQKQDAAVGLFELSPRPALGSGKSASFVSEHFAFKQRIRQCRTVDRHKWFSTPTGSLVKLPDDNLLSDSSFPANDEIDARMGNLVDDLAYFCDIGTYPDQFNRHRVSFCLH